MTEECFHSHRYALLQTDDQTVASCWQQFVTQFPTDGDCLEELYRRSELKKCSHCGSGELERIRGDRMLKCRLCKNKNSLTADTFFHRIKKFQAWLGAIWLMEQGVSVNPSRFCRFAGVAYATAHNIFKKLSIVIESNMSGEYVSSALLAPAISKRSRETPARTHPVAEEKEMEKKLIKRRATDNSCWGGEQIGNSSTIACEPDSELNCGPKSEWSWGTCVDSSSIERGQSTHEQRVYECLSDKPVQFDSLCVQLGMTAGRLSALLVMLELEGRVTRLAGDCYVRLMAQEPEIVSPTFGEAKPTEAAGLVPAIIDFIRLQFHGISRKYLQYYLAALWCLSDRVNWPKGSLLKACIEFRYVSYREILDYVSPPLVKISLCLRG